MAEKEQILMQSDIYEVLKENIVTGYTTKNGEALLFKDGSTLEYSDEYQAGTTTRTPSKEIRVSLNKTSNDSNDKAPYVLTILDQTNSKTISDGGFNSKLRFVSINDDGSGFSRETDEQLFPVPNNLNGKEVSEYLNDIGLDSKTIKSIVVQKNEEYANRSVLDFIKDKVNDLKSEIIERKENKRQSKNKI